MDIPPRFIIHQTRHWVLNHRMNSALPGYVMLSAKAQTNALSTLPIEAQAELLNLVNSPQKLQFKSSQLERRCDASTCPAISQLTGWPHLRP
ncbi:hypothetical protein D3C81_1643940 [compost metagenome]